MPRGVFIKTYEVSINWDECSGAAKKPPRKGLSPRTPQERTTDAPDARALRARPPWRH